MRPSLAHHPTRIAAVGFALALATALTSCGSDSADDADSVAGSDGAADPDTGAGNDTGNDTGSPTASYATITVDGTTYEATEEFTCLTLGGSVNAELISDDDLVRIGISLPPLDAAPGEWGPPSVYLRDDTDPDDQLHLESGGEVTVSLDGYADVAVVEDYTIDGTTGAGSATFVDPGQALAGTAEPVPGTFTVGCA